MPDTFYSMEIDDFWLLLKGWQKKENRYHDLLRHATMIISCSGFAGKEIVKRFDKLWPPVQSEKKISIREKALQQLKKLKEIDEKNKDLEKVKAILDGSRP